METIIEALHKGATVNPEKNAWTFLNDSGEPSESYSYAELNYASGVLAEDLLQNRSLVAGDRVLLVFFPGLDFTVSLLACFKAGIVAVPVFPPDPRKLKKDLHHFVNIQLSCGASTVLTNSQYNFVKKVAGIKSIFSIGKAKWPDLQWVPVDDVLKKGKAAVAKASSAKVVPGQELPVPSMDQIAFLQYTSGSTSEPKGVMISHGNLAHNLTLIIRELRANESTVNVSWLPQYHDMGLIGSYLGAIYCGGTGYYLSPISFLKDAVVWITAMSRYRCTHTQAPNFAYALATRKFKEALSTDPSLATKLNLDLSTLQHMINAAEPVDFNAIAEFYATFVPYGLPGDVVIPTYGLAEHTVFVCSGGKQVLTVTKASLEQGKIEILRQQRLVNTIAATTLVEGEFNESDAQTVVGCGYPGNAEGVEVLIVEPTIMESVGEDMVGEIWINSPSKAQGYWDKPEISQLEFHAVPNNYDGSGGDVAASRGFLCTGDLGFMHAGELFICGRSKDLIIVRGSNHYPQDIERTAELAHSTLLRPGCSAAFSLSPKQSGESSSSTSSSNSSSETVVYIAELKDGVQSSEYPRLAASCREVVSNHHGLALSVVCLLRTRSVPKTTSGKIARAWCRRAYLESTLQVEYRLDATEQQEQRAQQDSSGPATTTTTTDPTTGKSSASSSKYEPLSTEAGDATMQKHQEQQQQQQSIPQLSEEGVRALSEADVIAQLERLLLQVASQGPAPITSGRVDPNTPVSALGLDSMTIVQYKGVLEKKFYCDIPDDFLFTQLATLQELARAVHEGKLTVDQEERYNNAMAATTAAGGARSGAAAGSDLEDPNAATTVMVVTKKEPCCPWFTCCY